MELTLVSDMVERQNCPSICKVISSLNLFVKNKQGVVTVEFLAWIPIFLVILGTMTDASVLFLTQHNMTNVARDVVRMMSTGEFDTTAAEADVSQRLMFQNNTYQVTTTDIGGDVVVRVSTPIAAAGVFGLFFVSGDLTSQVTMRKEP